MELLRGPLGSFAAPALFTILGILQDLRELQAISGLNVEKL